MYNISISIQEHKFLGIDNANRKIFFIAGKIHLPENKPYMRHILFSRKGKEISIMPMYDEIMWLNNGERPNGSADYLHNNLTFFHQQESADIFMVDEVNFIGHSMMKIDDTNVKGSLKLETIELAKQTPYFQIT